MKELQWLWYIKDNLKKKKLVFIIGFFFLDILQNMIPTWLFSKLVYSSKRIFIHASILKHNEHLQCTKEGFSYGLGFYLTLGQHLPTTCSCWELRACLTNLTFMWKEDFLFLHLDTSMLQIEVQPILLFTPLLCCLCLVSVHIHPNFVLALQVIIVEPTSWQVVFLYMTTWIQFNNSIDLLNKMFFAMH